MSRDWYAERYAAGERLAATARAALNYLERVALFLPPGIEVFNEELAKALAEYERTKNAP
jgi:hypothetical protein